MPIIALAAAAVAFFFSGPVRAALPTSVVNPLLVVIMFGMGMTLKLSDFKVVVTRPKAALVGIASQFVIMPFSAWLLCLAFQLPTEFAVGVILLGCCPGGTASNVMTYLAKGDVALSVGMTAVTTLMAPVVTPALVLLLAGQSINVSFMSMFMSIVQVVILPIIMGFVVNFFFEKAARKYSAVLPLISVVSITVIIMAVVASSAGRLREAAATAALTMVVLVLHNFVGYALGYLAGKAAGLSRAQMRTLSIEVGMQNSGLAVSLANTHLASMPMAVMGGTVCSVWHIFSGSVYANFLASTKEKCERKDAGAAAGAGAGAVSCTGHAAAGELS